MSSEETSSRRTPVVGIVGGIGSGKSAVARGLAEDLSVFVVDADRIGHEVLTFPDIKTQLFQTFGADVFRDENEHSDIDRSQLARKVFGSEPHHKESLNQLEAIVHPEIRRQMRQQIDEAQPGHDVVLVDAAVLLESGWSDLCQSVVFVDVPFEDRLSRVVSNRGWSEDELRRREASQLPLNEKRQVADFVVDNSGEVSNSVEQLKQFVLSITED